MGQHRFVSRAVDTEGEQQPRQAADNHRGYGHNGWEDHGLTVTVVNRLPKPATAKPLDSAAVVAETEDLPSQSLVSSEVTLSQQALKGKALFMGKAQPGCGVCHSLTAANAQGVVGPNLDSLKPSLAQVINAVSQGVGAMPAYGEQLNSSEVEALAAFVFEASR